MIFVGVDPGAGGGIAALYSDGSVAAAVKMPETERDLLDTLEGIRTESDTVRGVIEFVRSSPQMGVTSAFSFGRRYGALRMALLAARIPFDEVVPRKWQPVVGVIYPKREKGDKTPRDKNVSKRRAQELWPDFNVTHAVADALLIAEYCRRLGANR